MNRTAPALLLWLSALTASCSGPSTTPESKPGIPTQVKFTDADSGTTQSVFVGQEVIITMPGNPTTGFDWRDKTVSDTVALLGGLGPGKTYIPYKAHSNRPPANTPPKPAAANDARDLDPPIVGEIVAGRGADYMATYKAVKAGKATITLEYKQHWLEDVPAAEKIVIHLEITD